jgi:uncharacterized protein
MWRIFIGIILLGVIYWVLKQAFSPSGKKSPKIDRSGEVLVQDPVCRCYLPKSQAQAVDFQGEKVFFCSDDCRRKFLAENPLRKG